jgi:phosphoribosyl 1,2-cyclic phosphate phosphodiesterase
MPLAPIKVTVLGSGTSMGVPSLGCHCRVCTSKDPRDNRLRPSLLLSREGQQVVIDTTPDFRQQALRVGLDRLDAILLTHGHADHILGFDDIRPFNIRQKTALPVYGNEETFEIIRRAFSYVFDARPTLSTIPSVTLNVVNGPFALMGVSFVPVPLLHGELKVLGFRFGRAAYLTDFSELPDSSAPLLEGLDDLIVDALRDIPHPMHQTVEQALALIDRLKPRRAWFTHIAHDLPHADTTERLRKLGLHHVALAYDGLELDVRVDADERAPVSRSFGAAGRGVPRAGAVSVFTTAEAWASHYAPTGRGSVLAIGNFDGIHLGHQAILRAAARRAQETKDVATALTFDPPPLKILRPESAPPRLSTNAQRVERFGALGIESAVVLPFTMELARLSPEDFVVEILARGLRVRAVLVGENFHFGHRGAGDVKFLRELGMRLGFEVVIIPPVVYRGEIVSSTAIRREIAAGEVTHASSLLGRPFALTGEIVSGTGTGRRFTFPTLNLAPEQELLPARGVYVTRTLLEGEAESRRSVTNIGMRPTFNGSALNVETHLLDFSGEIAAKRSEVQFWKRLREEKKFSGAEELRAQIARDIRNANRFFSRLRRFRSIRQPAALLDC